MQLQAYAVSIFVYHCSLLTLANHLTLLPYRTAASSSAFKDISQMNTNGIRNKKDKIVHLTIISSIESSISRPSLSVSLKYISTCTFATNDEKNQTKYVHQSNT